MQALAAGAGVIACGGGIVLDPVHRRLLGARCRVVWLEVSPVTAAGRLASAPGSRPLLAAAAAGPADPARWLEELLAVRRPLYEEVAQAHVAVEGRTADELADEVLRVLRERAG
jgi:shikimate kinase